MSRVLVTGAAGFVGRTLCEVLAAAGHDVIGTTRATQETASHLTTIADQTSAAAWRPLLEGIDAVVHLAARVHVMQETAADPLEEFRRANVAVTEALAAAAVEVGVRRFVFVSTIKVLGEGAQNRPYRHGDDAAPADPYAVSKCEAEASLRRIAGAGSMEFVILRPPMIYGPGVGGNLRRVFSLVRRGVPLPLGAVANARSMLAVGNLCDVIALCITEPGAAGETLLVADGQALSTPELFRIVAACMARPARLFPMPVPLLKAAGWLTGRSQEVDRLCGDLLIDIGRTREALRWTPAITPAEGLRAAVAHYLEQERPGDD